LNRVQRSKQEIRDESRERKA
jgi:hypothetical protein